ncbi:ORF1 [Panax cryptic virus 2]|nr:ORF1 [Panax cryptic virus 2]QED42884.1 ORF1 [Panax cryptic virus 2]
MALLNITGYDFTDYSSELEDLQQRHIHVVRREPNITYQDEFALGELLIDNYRLYEQELVGWSRSYYSGEEHMKAIFNYSSPNTPITNIDVNLYKQAMANVREWLSSLPTVRAFNVLTELNQVRYEPSSAAGYDYTGAKGLIDGINHDRAIRRAKAVLWSAIAPDGEGIEHVIRTSVPDVGYTRTQLTNLEEKTKVRSVWGRAFHYILLEGTCAQPLLDAFKIGETFFHVGSDPTVSVPQILSHIAGNCNWLYALDWSSFDATVSRFEINTAFDIIKHKIEFCNFETEQCFEICRQLFIHKKIAAPDGKIYWSHKGIPSGSYYTSIIGSIINRLRIEYIWLSIKGRGPKMCYTQGDDSICGDDERVKSEDFADIANNIGWLINPAKTETSRYPEFVTFLGRTSYGGLNHRNLIRCLRLLIFPEYPVPNGAISAYRAQAIATDAGNTSQILNAISRRLRLRYGVASHDEVPKELRLYKV